MLKTVVAIFKGLVQTKEALEEIQGESLANSRISVIVRQDYLRQRNFVEEIASEIAYYPVEKNLDPFNAWLVQAPPLDVPNLGLTLAAGPLAGVLAHLPPDAGLAALSGTLEVGSERSEVGMGCRVPSRPIKSGQVQPKPGTQFRLSPTLSSRANTSCRLSALKFPGLRVLSNRSGPKRIRSSLRTGYPTASNILRT